LPPTTQPCAERHQGRGSADALAPAPIRSAIAAVAIAPAPEPVEAFESLRGRAEPWLLESALRGEPLGRHSFVGADPWLVLRAWGDRLEIECRRALFPSSRAGATVCAPIRSA
jgi:hypothetical protein